VAPPTTKEATLQKRKEEPISSRPSFVQTGSASSSVGCCLGETIQMNPATRRNRKTGEDARDPPSECTRRKKKTRRQRSGTEKIQRKEGKGSYVSVRERAGGESTASKESVMRAKVKPT